MEQSDDKIRTVERALTEAYRAGAASAIGEVDVTQAVMRDIRRSVDDGNRWGPPSCWISWSGGRRPSPPRSCSSRRC